MKSPRYKTLGFRVTIIITLRKLAPKKGVHFYRFKEGDERETSKRDSGEGHRRGTTKRDNKEGHQRGTSKRDTKEKHERGISDRDMT